MNARRVATAALAVALLLSVPAVSRAQQTAEELYQAGLYQEEVQGDLQRAIGIFERILKEHAQNRSVGAQAQLHIGLCYEALGQTGAQRAYEEVIQNFADQRDVVAQARARLTALASPATAGMVARRLLSGEDLDQNNLVDMVPSPDGRRAAYVDVTLGGLHLRDLVSGKEEQLLPGLPGAFTWGPTWSPDGTRLAFTEMVFTEDDHNRASIKVLDLATRRAVAVPGTDVPLPSGGGAGNYLFPVDWSRDGASLLVNGLHLGLVPVEGGPQVTLSEAKDLGDWASLSPDGRYVVYDAGPSGGKQVFVQSVGGGAPRQITDGPGECASPRWSPDGKAIAYAGADGIALMPMTDGAPAGPAKLAYPNTEKKALIAWTEAGGLYFTLYNQGEFPYQIPVDASTAEVQGAAQRLPHHPKHVQSFAWSPDGRSLAFVDGWGKADLEVAIYAADGSASAVHQVAEPGEYIFQIWWRDDGNAVRWASGWPNQGGTIKEMDLDTNQPKALFHRTTSATRSPWPFHQTLDGRRTLFWSVEALPDSSRAGWMVTDSDLSAARLVAPMKDEAGIFVGGDAQLSPSGDRVLFTRQAKMVPTLAGKAGPEPGTLWVVDADGSGLRKLGSYLFMQSYRWDPTGRFVAYTANTDLTTTVLRIVDVASGAARVVPLPNGGKQSAAVADWSRDGRLLGIVAQESTWEYWVIRGLEGGGP